jgi:two-component system, cell cycle response regulator DivK
MTRRSVLVVEDHPVNQRLLGFLLESAGFTVHAAADAHDALRLLETVLPDLILMDIQLPGVNGLELARLIRADARLQQVPIVAVTAYAMKGDEEKARAAGCNGYIPKPIDVESFIPRLMDLLGEAGPAPE